MFSGVAKTMKVYTLKNNGILYSEEIPTNNASSGSIAGLPPDDPPVRKKKKFRTDLFQRIKKLKEDTMEDQQFIQEKDDTSNSETGATMRFIQQKRKVAKKQEREKRAQLRKQEIQALTKAKAKDYQKKAGERQKKIAQDINRSAEKSTKKEEFDWVSSFSALNETFATLTDEQKERFLYLWLEHSEDNQDKLIDIISEEGGVEVINSFIETL